jgi:hypothetical protein
MAAGQANLLVEAKAEIERMGPNPAILGRQGESSSGRAQLVRQQAGLTEQAVIYGGIEEWELRLYRQMWNRCRQYWTAPQYVRITDDEGAIEVLTSPGDFEAVKHALEAAGWVAELAEVTLRAENSVALSGPEALTMQKLLDVLEDLDDVQNVFHNAEFVD